MDLTTLLEVVEIAPGVHRGHSPATTLQRVFGGQVAAQALVAGSRDVPKGRIPHSLRCDFLRPGRVAVPIDYRVDTLRDGRTFTTRRVLAEQGGRAIFHAVVSFHRPEPGQSHADPAPEAPAPEGLPDLAAAVAAVDETRGGAWRGLPSLDLRAVDLAEDGGPGHVPGDPTSSMRWARIVDPLPADPSIHAAALTYVSDLSLLGTALTAHGVRIGDPDISAASLDHAVWFHGPVDANEWHLFHNHSPWTGHGRGFATGTVYDLAKRRVASMAQEGLLRQTSSETP